MSRRRTLKNSLLNGGLLNTMEGGAITLDPNSTVGSTGPSLNIIMNKSILGGKAFTRVQAVENMLGGVDTISGLPGSVSISPNDFIKTYTVGTATELFDPSKLDKTAYDKAFAAAPGIFGYIYDQINASVLTKDKLVTALNSYLADMTNNVIGSNVYVTRFEGGNAINITYDGSTVVNRLLTLQDLAGRMDANGKLTFSPDIQAVIESSPLAQFKHLPAMSVLNTASYVATATGTNE